MRSNVGEVAAVRRNMEWGTDEDPGAGELRVGRNETERAPCSGMDTPAVNCL